MTEPADSVPAPPGAFCELGPAELAALDVVMGAMGFHRVAGGDPAAYDDGFGDDATPGGGSWP